MGRRESNNPLDVVLQVRMTRKELEVLQILAKDHPTHKKPSSYVRKVILLHLERCDPSCVPATHFVPEWIKTHILATQS